jgi:hypothetical protein
VRQAASANRGCGQGCGDHGHRGGLLHHHGRSNAHAFDNANFAFGFGDFQFRNIRVRHQVNQCFEFAQIHKSSDALSTCNGSNLHQISAKPSKLTLRITNKPNGAPFLGGIAQNNPAQAPMKR